MSATSQRISPKLYQERTAAIAAQADALRLVAVAVDLGTLLQSKVEEL